MSKEEKIKYIKDNYHNTKQVELAKDLGMSLSQIKTFINRNGLTKYRRITEFVKKRVVKLTNDGMSKKEVAETLKISQVSVFNILKETPKIKKITFAQKQEQRPEFQRPHSDFVERLLKGEI